MQPAAKYTEPFHIKLTKEQKAQALRLSMSRGQSIADLFRRLLDREIAAEPPPRRTKTKAK